jgi:Ca2+-binding EF-hand superfamily protein
MPILSDETKAAIEAKFNEVDTDGSGYLDASEIKTFLEIVAEAEGFEAPSEEQIKARLDQIPTDEPGKIKLEGIIFAVAMLKVLAITMALFSAADTDGSGSLEADELKEVSKNIHQQVGEDAPSDEDLDAMVEEIGPPVDFDRFASFVIPVILAICGVGAE